LITTDCNGETSPLDKNLIFTKIPNENEKILNSITPGLADLL